VEIGARVTRWEIRSFGWSARQLWGSDIWPAEGEPRGLAAIMLADDCIGEVHPDYTMFTGL